ncbi:MAG: MFS transporter [Chloroflexi bacterium]|nr:MFS transporter [Chloroflexota bacterium]
MSRSSPRTVTVLALLGVAAFAAAWNFTFLAPVLPSVAADTGVSVTAAGQLVTVSALVAVVCLALLGPLSDRYGRRPMLMLGLAAMALAAGGSALTSEYGLLMALRILSGIGDALLLPSAYAAVSDYFEGKDREVALNVILVPLGAAVVVGLPVVVLIDDVLDWHAAFAVFAAFNLAGLAGVRWLLPPVAAPAPAQRGLAAHYRDSYGEVLGSRSALAVLAAAVLGAATWTGMVTYAGAFFQDELDAHGAGLSAMFAAVGGSYVAGGALGVMLARRLRPRPIALWSATVAALLPLAVVASTDLLLLTLALASGFAASRAPGVGALNNMLLDLAPHSQGTAISTHGVVFMSGALVGAAGGGAAIAVEGYFGMAALFATLGLASAGLLAMPLGEPLRAGADAALGAGRPRAWP